MLGPIEGPGRASGHGAGPGTLFKKKLKRHIKKIILQPIVRPFRLPQRMAEEAAWVERVVGLLQRKGPLNSSDIGNLERRRPGMRSITKILTSDTRFILNSAGRFSLATRVERSTSKAVVIRPATKRIRAVQQNKVAAFRPANTLYNPSSLCWEIVLSNQCTAVALSSWRWIWMLMQVSSVARVDKIGLN